MTQALNVLLITADQYRGDFMGCAGHPTVRTPQLDALGRLGAYFPNAYSPVPVCVPARYAIMTGRVPISFGMHGNASMPMPAGVVTLPTAFGNAGYATAAIGKMHFTPWREPYGFQTFIVSEEGRQAWDGDGDAYQQYLREVGWGGCERAHGIGNNDVHTSASPLPLEHYHTTWAARTTANWIREQVRGTPAQGSGDAPGGSPRPFFAWCSFTKPHSPYDPPEPYDRLYDSRSFPRPIGDVGDIAQLSPAYQENRNTHLWDTLGPEQIQRARAMYAGNVTLIDTMVGELRQTLEELGIADSTVICFTADHGDLLGDHGQFFKQSFFRGSWHVPFVLYAPGQVESVGRSGRFVSTQDVYPTLLSLAGVPVPQPDRVHGLSLADGLRGGPEIVFGSVRRAPNQVHSARTSRWSYVVHARGAYEELYDLEADPDERLNLAETTGDGSQTAPMAVAQTAKAELKSRLEVWLVGLGDDESVDGEGRLRLDPDARGWQPQPAPRTSLGLRPY